ncbi:MAG: type II toxin-antitoxin system HicA family toxin [Oscillospiraceae bacterium]|nr:type II toxin-antitoxin system HicA family toxin [Oscillospiraceae bacterium]
MTAKELKRRLIAEGWIISQGGNHEIAKHPKKPGAYVPIPRHTGDIPAGTLHSILKATGLR